MEGSIGQHTPPNDFLGSLHREWSEKDDTLKDHRIFPVGFTLTEGSNSKLEGHYMAGRTYLVLGLDEISLAIEALLIPVGTVLPAGCDGFDHLPCLKTLWPLYAWELSEINLQSRGKMLFSPIVGQRTPRRAVRVSEDLDMIIQLTGLPLAKEFVRECRSCEKIPCECLCSKCLENPCECGEPATL